MSNLETSYLGLNLKNPVVVSSSGLTNSTEKIKELEANGAGAVVLKSLFEEQINMEAGRQLDGTEHTEGYDYIKNYTKSKSVNDYLALIQEAKKEVNIPIIASINCVSSSEWVSFASRIEEAGADALELNLFFLPADKKTNAQKYEDLYLELAENLKKTTSLPLAFKLGNHFTNPARLIYQLRVIGIEAVVLFNRFYAPDIDINQFDFKSASVFSEPSEIRQSLRWVGIISSLEKDIEIAASTGIHSGEDVVKQILAGATITQICSTIYKNGAEHIQTMVDFLDEWMKKNNFSEIQDFRGKMSYQKIQDPQIYERSQFMRYFSGIE